MTTTTYHRHEIGATTTLGRSFDRAAHHVAEAILRSVETLKVWRTRKIQRRQLMELNDHLLKDIGISRVDAAFEASKPFWRE